MSLKISYQGEAGAYSDLASTTFFPDGRTVGYPTFEAAVDAVVSGQADYAVIPVLTKLGGPVFTSIALLRESPMYVLTRGWQPVRHCLMAIPGAKLENIKAAHSHWQALRQCHQTLKKMNIAEAEEYDTAGAAKMIAIRKDYSQAAIASSLAAKIHGLEILKEGMEDGSDNQTLFFVLSAAAETESSQPVQDALTAEKL